MYFICKICSLGTTFLFWFCRKLKEMLLNFVKSLLRGERPFRLWLYCIPTLHYLEGRYQPFQTAPDSTNHRDVKPVWWGIDSIKLDLEIFKKRPAVLRFL